jgi:hypothetical protein
MRSVVILADLPNIPCRSAVQLGVSRPICGAAVMCRPTHGCPVLLFVPSANNCRSGHIHRMLLSDVAVTTERHQKRKCMDLILEKSFILNVCHFFFLLDLKLSPKFELWSVCKYLKCMFESHILE